MYLSRQAWIASRQRSAAAAHWEKSDVPRKTPRRGARCGAFDADGRGPSLAHPKSTGSAAGVQRVTEAR
jgi:hypothetical protein